MWFAAVIAGLVVVYGNVRGCVCVCLLCFGRLLRMLKDGGRSHLWLGVHTCG